MRLLWINICPRAIRLRQGAEVASPLKSILFGIVVYLLFYPAFREIPGLGRLALPGQTNKILLACPASRYAASSQRSSFYFLPGSN
jgi:hypothetical protein